MNACISLDEKRFSGASQGSVLGPLFITTYDKAMGVFVDDTSRYSKHD